MNSPEITTLLLKWSEQASAGNWQEVEIIEQNLRNLWDAELEEKYPVSNNRVLIGVYHEMAS